MKAALYYTHCEALGHSTRIMRMIEVLHSLGAQILLIQAGPPAYLEHPPFVQYKELPHPPYSKKDFYGTQEELTEEQRKIRLLELKQTIDLFIPDVFITEHFPFGRPKLTYELMPLLRYLRIRHPACKTIGCSGYPVISFDYERFIALTQMYDQLIIFTPEETDFPYLKRYLMTTDKKEMHEYYEKCFHAIQHKLAWAGYLLSSKEGETALRESGTIKKKYNPESKPLVLISRGGGVINPHILTKSMLAAKQLGWTAIGIPGPASTQQEIDFFRKIADKNTHLIPSVPDLMPYIIAADMSVSMAGYNTCIETAAAQKPAIVFPSYKRDGSIALEQGYRAYMFQQLARWDIAQYATITVQGLAEMIRVQQQNKPLFRQEWFEGSQNLKSILGGIKRAG